MRCGARPPISTPSNRICPRCNLKAPLARWTSVVLPVPLGPIRAARRPSRNDQEQSSTAATPPKWWLTPSTTSIGLPADKRVHFRVCAAERYFVKPLPFRQDAGGPKPDDQH